MSRRELSREMTVSTKVGRWNVKRRGERAWSVAVTDSLACRILPVAGLEASCALIKRTGVSLTLSLSSTLPTLCHQLRSQMDRIAGHDILSSIVGTCPVRVRADWNL